MQKHTILAFMQDKPGVLNKIAMLLRRKMYNVDSLTVCKTETKGISRMTITLKTEDVLKVKHIVKQIEKIIEVISAEELDPEESFWREIALIKVRLKNLKIENLKINYDFKILSENDNHTILQIAGTEKYIDAFISEVGIKNIIEIARSGVTALKE